VRDSRGITLIEHLISVAIITMMATTLVSAYGTLVASKARSRLLQEAVQYGREYAELLFYISHHTGSLEKVFHMAAEVPAGRDAEGCTRLRIRRMSNKYGADKGTGHGGDPMFQDTEDNGVFARAVDFCNIYRDANGNIVSIHTPGAMLDMNMVSATVTVLGIRAPLPQPVEISTYLVKAIDL
jgi:Tfp pilus assembly protein PilE